MIQLDLIIINNKNNKMLLITFQLFGNLLSILFKVILISTFLSYSFCNLQYPVTIGGFSGDTILQMFQMDAAGNLAAAAISSDTAIVSNPNTNIVLYFPVSASTWAWAKQLDIGLTLIDMRVRTSDSARVALFYDSSLLVVLDTADGSLVRAQTNSAMRCNLGCAILYPSATLYLLAVYFDGTTNNLGATSFDPTISLSPSSVNIITYPTYQFYKPMIDITDDNRLVLSTESSSTSFLIGLPNDLSSITYIYSMLPDTRVRSIKFINGAARRVFGYFQIMSQPNSFHVCRFFYDASTPTSELYFTYTSTTATQIDFLALEVYTYKNIYLLVYFHPTNQVVLFDAFLVFGPATYSFTAYQIQQTSLPLALSNGAIIQSIPNYFIGGNDAKNLFTVSSNGNSLYSTAFVYNFQTGATPIPTKVIIDSMPITNAITPFMTAIVTGYTFSINNLVVTPENPILTNFLTPTVSTTVFPNCVISIQNPNGYPQSRNFYIGDTSPQFTVVPGSLSICTGLSCSYLLQLDIPAPDLAFSYDQATSIVSFSTTTLSRDGETHIVQIAAVMPPSYLTACAYMYQQYQIKIVNPQIVTSVINDMMYNLGASQLDIQITAFSNDKGITGDPKLNIVYSLVKSDGTSYSPGVVINFNSATRTVSMLTSDATLPRNNPMKIIAYFAYLPTKTVEVPFNIVLEKCFQTKITASLEPIVYQIGEPQLIAPITTFSNTYGADCGPFTYIATYAKKTPISFNVDTFTIYTTNTAMDSQTPLTLAGKLNQPITNSLYKSATVSTQIIMFDPAQTFITPQIIDPIEYILRDPALSFIVPVFPSSKPYIQAKYDLQNQDGSSYDPYLFSFDPYTRELRIQSNDTVMLGVYSLGIKAFYALTAPYYVSSLFTVTALHWCTRNFITASPIDSYDYDVTDPVLEIQLTSWQMSMSSECQPAQYTAKLTNGKALPSFIKFDPNTPGFKIFTPIPKDAKQYQIAVTGLTKIYDPQSVTKSIFSLNVQCKTKKIFTQQGDLTFNYKLGSPLPITIQVQQFILQPKCQGSDVQYKLSIANLEILPSFVSFDQKSLQITISDDGTLSPGQLDIDLIASVEQMRGDLMIYVHVESGSLTSEEDAMKLVPLTLEVQSKQNPPLLYTPVDFQDITQKPIQLINPDRSATFITFLQAQYQLQIAPGSRDSGTYRVTLVSFTNDDVQPCQSILQTVNIKVNPEKGSNLKEVKAIISDISKTGLVIIDFNQKLVSIRNVSSAINSTVIQLIITNKPGKMQPDVEFNWTCTNFYQYQPRGSMTDPGYSGSRLTLQLKFKDPLTVSLQDYTYLNIFVLNKALFVSDSSLTPIMYKYKMTKKIPRQLDSTSASKYLDSFASVVQTGINIISSSNSFIQLLFAFAMSRLWGMIKSIQIILLFPLTLVEIPPNVQLLYFFMTYNFNMELIPSDALSLNFLDFGSDSDVSASEPFNDKFDDQDIFFIEALNGSSNISNVNAVFIFSVLVHFLYAMLERYNKNYKALDFLFGVFVYNFIILMLTEYSLQMIIFSIVNILQYDSLDSNGQILSFSIATGYLGGYIFIMMWITYLVIKAFKNDKPPEQYLNRQFPKLGGLFELIRPESKWAQLYYAIFLLRRIALASVIVLIKDHFFQIYALIFVSLASLAYMIQVRPFTDNSLNHLETFNEIIILVSCYHLLFFSGANPDFRLKYLAGWSLDLLIIFQFFLNLMSFVSSSLARTRLVLRGLYIKHKLRAAQRAKIYATEQQQLQKASEINSEQAVLQTENMNLTDIEDNGQPYRLDDNSQLKIKGNFENKQQPLKPRHSLMIQQDFQENLDDNGFAYRFDELQLNQTNLISQNPTPRSVTRNLNPLPQSDLLEFQQTQALQINTNLSFNEQELVIKSPAIMKQQSGGNNYDLKNIIEKRRNEIEVMKREAELYYQQ